VIDYLDVSAGNVILELTDDGRARIEAAYGADAVAAVDRELAALNAAEDEQQRQDIAEALDSGESVTVAGVALTEDDVRAKADNLIAETLRSVVDASASVGIFSVLVLAYAASGIFGTVRRSLDAVWDIRVRRPLVQGKLVDLAMLFGIMLLLGLFALSIAITATLRAARAARDDPLLAFPGGDSVFWWLIGIGTAGVFSFLFCLLAYRYGPSVSNRFRDIWLGAAVAAAGFELLKYGYGIYIENFSSYDVVYGALGGVLLFMLFINLGAWVFLFGAELAAEYPRVRSGLYDEPEAAAAAPRSLREMAFDAVRGLFVRRQP
jgi:membrane protein